MQNPACATVQVVSAAVIVKVSALKRSCLDYMSFAQGTYIRLHIIIMFLKKQWLVI